MLTCASCERQVVPAPAFDAGWLLVWFLLGGVGAIFYMLYSMARPATRCPICEEDVYGRVKAEWLTTTLAQRREAQQAESSRQNKEL